MENQNIEIISIPYQVYKSDINILLDRLESLEKIIEHQNKEPDEKLKIGEVWNLLKQNGKVYANAQNVKPWLKRNKILAVIGATSCCYYWKSQVLKAIENEKNIRDSILKSV